MSELPLKFLEIPSNVISSVHLVIIRLEKQDPEFHKIVFEKMLQNNIGVQLHYTPIHLQPYYKKFSFSEGDFPESEKYSHNAFSIPVFTKLKFREQKRVISTLTNILRQT